MYIFRNMNELKTKPMGGRRKGAGRPSEGKARYNVTLTAENVTKAKKRTSNLSGVLDDLLAGWLKR